ncbi:nucleotide exchange factor GrpE [Streptomyces sp. G45]|uniref:nucleotide exchange factor GrpE n=1 Tax=Streptomyces sp. G45 TaxID=3406627 RepID=UPI003C21413F
MDPVNPPERPSAAAAAAYEGTKALAARDAAHRAHTERLLLVCADTLDALDRLLAAGPPADPAAYHRSLELVARQLESALGREELDVLGRVGERAEPATHHVVAVRPAPPGAAADEVLEVLRRGYRYRGHVLRAARVAVAATGGTDGADRASQEGTP